jgi:hypothetical protein
MISTSYEEEVITKKEIERAKNRWLLWVVLTFVILVAVLIGTDKVLELYGLSATYLKIMFAVVGSVYLIQIFSYKKIRCTNCGKPIFTQYSILFSTPKECKRCKTRIEP